MSKLVNSIEFRYTEVPIDDTKKDSEQPKTPPIYGYGVRHMQLMILFLTLVASFIARSHLGVTIVAMTSNDNHQENYTANNLNNSKTLYNADEIINDAESFDSINITKDDKSNVTIESNYTAEVRSIYSTFTWTKSIQEMVLTSFFTGYFLMMVPIGLVCQRWGGKVPLQLSMFVNAVTSISTPWLGYWGGWQAVCACRLLQGLSQAGTYPAVQTLIAQWVPDCEQSKFISYVYTGSTTGSVIGFQLGGLLSDAFGWPAPFWAVGLICIIMFVLLTIFGAASPRVHKTISEEERNYIIRHTQATKLKAYRIPWKSLMTCKAVLANFGTAVGSGVSFVFFFTQMPSYIHYIYGIDVKNSGMLTSLPYVGSIFASVAFGLLSDYFINHNILTKKNTRRFSNLFSQLGTALALIAASYANSTAVSVTLFVVYMMCEMGVHTGWMVNQIDLSPNYSGVLISISNALSNLVVIIMPFVISNVVVDLKNVFQWRIMLYLEAAIIVIPAIIFTMYISTEVQPWNDRAAAEEETKKAKLESLEKNVEKS